MFLKTLLFDRPKSYFLFDQKFYQENNREFKNAIQVLLKIDDLCEARDVSFDLVILPYEFQLRNPAETNTVPQKLLFQTLTSHGVHVRDPFNHLMETSNPKRLYLYGDGIHFSKLGHRKIADFMLKNFTIN